MSISSCSQCNSIQASPLDECCEKRHLSHIQCIFDKIQAGNENCPLCKGPFLDRWFVEVYDTLPPLQSTLPCCLAITSMQKRRINQAIKESNLERIQSLVEQGNQKGIVNLWETLLSDAVIAKDLESIKTLFTAHEYQNFEILMSINREENLGSSEDEHTRLQILQFLLSKSDFHPKFLLQRLEKAISHDEHQIKEFLLCSIHTGELLDEALLADDETTLGSLFSIIPLKHLLDRFDRSIKNNENRITQSLLKKIAKEHLFNRLEKAILEGDKAIIQPLSALLAPFQKQKLIRRSSSSTSV